MAYYLIVALQGYCIYHLYRNRNENYWFFVIMFVPVVGSIIYLITQVYNKRDVEKIHDNLTTIINPTKQVKDLERKLQFSETYQNRVDLADAYLQIQDYSNAIKHYELALQDTWHNQYYVISQLLKCYYYTGDYGNVVASAEKIKEEKEFMKSRVQFFYGLALKEQGRMEEAEEQLRYIDTPYSNYEERLQLVHFLNEKGDTKEANVILRELHQETQNLTKPNRKKYRAVITEVEKMLSTQ